MANVKLMLTVENRSATEAIFRGPRPVLLLWLTQVQLHHSNNPCLESVLLYVLMMFVLSLVRR